MMIELNQVNYTYEKENFSFNLSVTKQERLAILGPSGAGKSTLLSLVAGFIYADQGSIWLNGIDVTTMPANKRPVSMLFQENNLFTHLSVWQNIALGINPALKLSTEQCTILNDITERVGLLSYLDRYPHQLSGGQRQRVAIARCLVQGRPILLLDEPFSSLDPQLRLEMLALVSSICEQYQLTLMMVTHNLEDAKYIASRTLIIDKGSIATDQETATLFTDPNKILY